MANPPILLSSPSAVDWPPVPGDAEAAIHRASWQQVPCLATDQNQATEVFHILELLNQPDLYAPSHQAGLDPNLALLIPTIEEVNKQFVRAVENYRQTLISAVSKDFNHSLSDRDHTMDSTRACLTGAARMAAHTPVPFDPNRFETDYTIIRGGKKIINLACQIFIGSFLSFFGRIEGAWNEERYTSEIIGVDNSKERIRWAIATIEMENERKRTSVDLMKIRVSFISRNIRNVQGEERRKLIKELQALDAIAQTCFNFTLKINRNPISEFLQQFN